MRATSNIENLKGLVSEIEDLEKAKNLLWRLFFSADEGRDMSSNLRNEILQYFQIDENE